MEWNGCAIIYFSLLWIFLKVHCGIKKERTKDIGKCVSFTGKNWHFVGETIDTRPETCFKKLARWLWSNATMMCPGIRQDLGAYKKGLVEVKLKLCEVIL